MENIETFLKDNQITQIFLERSQLLRNVSGTPSDKFWKLLEKYNGKILFFKSNVIPIDQVKPNIYNEFQNRNITEIVYMGDVGRILVKFDNKNFSLSQKYNFIKITNGQLYYYDVNDMIRGVVAEDDNNNRYVKVNDKKYSLMNNDSNDINASEDLVIGEVYDRGMLEDRGFQIGSETSKNVVIWEPDGDGWYAVKMAEDEYQIIRQYYEGTEETENKKKYMMSKDVNEEKKQQVGCLMAYLPNDVAELIEGFKKSEINKNDIYVFEDKIGEDKIGEENQKDDTIHTTILYGFDNQIEPEEVFKELKDINITLDEIIKFSVDTNPYDVLVISIKSPELVEFNKKLKDKFEHIDTYKYHPHITLSYIKKGTGEEFVGSEEFKGIKCKLTDFFYSNYVDGEKRINDIKEKIKSNINDINTNPGNFVHYGRADYQIRERFTKNGGDKVFLRLMMDRTDSRGKDIIVLEDEVTKPEWFVDGNNKIKAYNGKAWFITPQGKIIHVEDTHESWILDSKHYKHVEPILTEEEKEYYETYGALDEQTFDFSGRDTFDWLDLMVTELGWARIRQWDNGINVIYGNKSNMDAIDNKLKEIVKPRTTVTITNLNSNDGNFLGKDVLEWGIKDIIKQPSNIQLHTVYANIDYDLAGWISPSGKIYEIPDDQWGGAIHSQFIYYHPNLFGYKSSEDINMAADREVIQKALKEGWMRYRKGLGSLHIECEQLNKIQVDNLVNRYNIKDERVVVDIHGMRKYKEFDNFDELYDFLQSGVAASVNMENYKTEFASVQKWINEMMDKIYNHSIQFDWDSLNQYVVLTLQIQKLFEEGDNSTKADVLDEQRQSLHQDMAIYLRDHNDLGKIPTLEVTDNNPYWTLKSLVEKIYQKEVNKEALKIGRDKWYVESGKEIKARGSVDEAIDIKNKIVSKQLKFNWEAYYKYLEFLYNMDYIVTEEKNPEKFHRLDEERMNLHSDLTADTMKKNLGKQGIDHFYEQDDIYYNYRYAIELLVQDEYSKYVEQKKISSNKGNINAWLSPEGKIYQTNNIKSYEQVFLFAKNNVITAEERYAKRVNWAREELKRIGMYDGDPLNEKMADSILEMLKEFSSVGHSGGSAMWAIPVINELLQWHSLTPITSDPNEWTDVSEYGYNPGKKLYQNNRDCRMFSEDLMTYYNVDDNDSDIRYELNNTNKINASKKVIAYHGSNVPIKKFDTKMTNMGIFWFSENKQDVMDGKKANQRDYIMTAEITVNKTAGWDEYDKLGLGEIEQAGFDSIKLDEDWIIFDSKNIKVINIEKNVKSKITMGFETYLKQDKLPPMIKLPEKGTYPAFRTDDGSIYYDPNPTPYSTHYVMAEKLKVPFHRIIDGGWIVDGVYEGTDRSDSSRLGEQYRAKKYVEYITKNKVESKKKDYSGIGVYWSWDREAAEPHWGYDQGEEILLIGEVSEDSINIKQTLLQNMNMSEYEEKEITLLDNAKVKIIGVEYKGKEYMFGNGVIVKASSIFNKFIDLYQSDGFFKLWVSENVDRLNENEKEAIEEYEKENGEDPKGEELHNIVEEVDRHFYDEMWEECVPTFDDGIGNVYRMITVKEPLKFIESLKNGKLPYIVNANDKKIEAISTEVYDGSETKNNYYELANNLSLDNIQQYLYSPEFGRVLEVVLDKGSKKKQKKKMGSGEIEFQQEVDVSNIMRDKETRDKSNNLIDNMPEDIDLKYYTSILK